MPSELASLGGRLVFKEKAKLMSRLTVPVTKNDHIQGSRSAPVVLLEYGDYECPYCGDAYYVIKQVQAEAGDRLAFVFRNFPLSQIHPHALRAAYAAEAADLQKNFWPMHDLIYENQDTLEDEYLISFAIELGLDIGKFVADMASPAVEEKVRSDFMSGIRSGVNGTPTFFINGKRHDGSYEFEVLMEAVEAAAGQRVG
jgi:protein-disulfide isomerase